MNPFIIAVGIFALVYISIMTERVHKMIAALLGATVMIAVRVVDQHEAFQAIDLNVIFLLLGMMIIVHIMAESGVFQWLAIKVAQAAEGKPLKIMIMLGLSAAFISAFLDNVTTMILMAPMMFLLADTLDVDPIPFLIIMVIGSNIGGTATLIGDPPNILIGSAADLSFTDFMVNMGPVVLVILVFYVLTIAIMFHSSFHVSTEARAHIRELKAERAIKDKKLLIKSLVVLGVVIVLFLLHSSVHLEVATIALLGASVLMLITGSHPEEILKHVEWVTLMFFIGLFILVEGLVKVGFVEMLAKTVINAAHGDMTILTMSILWFSAIASAIIDNIPYTATMIPLIKQVGVFMTSSGVQGDMHVLLRPLWWSLVLGACLGGNGTLIGASANVVVAGIAKKNGKVITFVAFLKYGLLFMVESMIISTIYVYFVYLR
ncbi:MAG: ArsB/NhaD family transporter [Candidatus Babeliaceae bacterium]|nr:ArsB/NhaD family transporter [Candidatus Babeliaceae bacterium]